MTPTATSSTPTVAMRLATPADDATVERLATLDSATVPAGPLLIGTLDGVPAAAIGITSGDVVADPFRPTAALVDLLRLRAEHLCGPARSPGGVRRLARALRTRTSLAA
ncbi:hypothetical protein NBH00_11530 [Paraconexibacter antarcticus]|uniref:GNAT family N-acetyltransferase n=1 Tax=Paraconexibacter antarcticus TaxID=2949664 RepID=A0ABY5E0X8_9ACTN|nr:hypothetical protein [Paraconexibacter antarcticus]UTI66812.1 hypothetical protein NBH00_11530 [Paraconexibacter antarcticus]